MMQILALFAVLAGVAAQDNYLRVFDLLDDSNVDHNWMEIGYTNLNDVSWTEIETTEDTLNPNNDKDMSVFLSLPDYGGPTYNDGWPMVPKLQAKAVKTGRGTYKFSAILVQPNDSYCPLLWWTPQHSGDISVGWMVVEEGVYNVSDTMFVIDHGDITRDNSVFIKQDTPSLYHAKSVHNYTSGCDASDPDAPCTYIDKPNGWNDAKPWLHLGAIQQLQTSVNKGPDGGNQELYLSVRARHVFTDRIVLMLMTHSVFQNHSKVVTDLPYNQNFSFPDYPDYETIMTPEVVSYFVWEKDLRLKCVEGLVMETFIRYNEITSNAIQTPFYFKYSIVPGLFGMLGTLNSVADSTVLRVFNRSLDQASFITQEDQCTDEEMKHITLESAFAMVIGDSPDYFEGQPPLTQCFIVYDKQPCVYDILLVDTFGDGWGNNYFEVEIAGEISRYDVPCGSESIQISTTFCEFNAQMKCDGACKTTWENYWSFSFRGADYYGDHDSTLHVKDHMVTVTDPVNVDPNARVNECDQCKIAPPPGTAEALAAAAAAKAAAAAAAAEAAANPMAQLIGPNVVVGDGEASPAASAGAGQVMTLIVDTGVFFQISAEGTASPITGVSFSVGASGVNGASIYDMPGFPVDGMAMIEEMDGSFVVSSEMVEVLLAGGVYCVVYTQEFPNGELRGQVVASQVGTSFGLLPDNEVPPATSTGFGQLDMYRHMDGDNVGAVLFSLKIMSADSAVTAVHLHAGAAGESGALFYDFGLSASTFPAQFTGIITDDTSLAAFAMNMNSMYCNVHTAGIPSGELRGQIDFSMSDMSSADDDKSTGDDDKAQAKPKPKPIVPVVIELFESAVSVNGWYDDSAQVDMYSDVAVESPPSPGRRLEEEVPTTFNVPRILTYPKYTIANAENTKLIHTGSICKQEGKRASFERCEEKLPANGNFIFRATGWVPKNDRDTWKFCGMEGSIGQELQFSMKKGACVPGELVDAVDMCADGGSVLNMVGEVLFDGVVLNEMSHYEALVFENEIAEMLGSVVSVSVDSYKQTGSGLLVTFGVSVAAERYNVDATVVDNIAPLVATLQSSLNRKLVNNLFMTSASKIEAAGYPRSSLTDSTHASLVKFTFVGVKYISPLPADKTVSYPDYNVDAVSSNSAQQGSSSSSVSVASFAAVFGVVIVAAFVTMKVRGASSGPKFDPLPTASEHVVELAEDKLSSFDLGMENPRETL
jgi:hypothetical protein